MTKTNCTATHEHHFAANAVAMMMMVGNITSTHKNGKYLVFFLLLFQRSSYTVHSHTNATFGITLGGEYPNIFVFRCRSMFSICSTSVRLYFGLILVSGLGFAPVVVVVVLLIRLCAAAHHQSILNKSSLRFVFHFMWLLPPFDILAVFNPF